MKESKLNQQDRLKVKIQSVIALFSNGQIEEALNAVESLIDDFPNEPLLFNISGACYQAIGKLNESVKNFEIAVTLKPDYAEAHYNLGVALKGLFQFDAAVKSYRNAITINPHYSMAHNNLGNVLRELGQMDTAIEHFEYAIAYKSDFAEAYYNLGKTYTNLSQHDNAAKNFERAITLKPDMYRAYFNLGVVCLELGRETKAINNYEKTIALKPDFVPAYLNLIAIKNIKEDDSLIDQVHSLLSSNEISQTDRMTLCFSLAKIYEDLQDYDKFFKFLHEANQLGKQELKYSIDNVKKRHLTLRRLFDSSEILNDKLLLSQISTIRPVFIVGMPRSGTTLVEQIIASHHEVYGAGELYNLQDSVSPIIESHLNQNTNVLLEKDFLSIRQQYLDLLSGFKVPEDVITDKMPLNFRYIGFILSALPEAKIVHLKRDAIATCWSNYKCFFINKENGYSYDLDDLAKFFSLYTDLMDYWHQLFPEKIYDMCYEDLTTNQEEETRKLLEYCELDWDENCLNFHTNKRAVKTASALQVREKMYQGSSEAWKKYEAYIQPLIKALSSY